MFRKRIFLIFIALFFPLLAVAQTPVEQLKQILGNVHSLQANFVQTVFDDNHKIIQQSKGKMILQRPGLFRWEVSQPAKQLLIADGKKVWFYDTELQQVTVQKQQAINENSPALLLSGSDKQLTEEFIVQREVSVNADQQIFTLLPKTKNTLFRSVQLVFQDNQLRRMRLIDNLTQATVIEFNQLQVNKNISQNLFHFVTPKGVDVVSEG